MYNLALPIYPPLREITIEFGKSKANIIASVSRYKQQSDSLRKTMHLSQFLFSKLSVWVVCLPAHIHFRRG